MLFLIPDSFGAHSSSAVQSCYLNPVGCPAYEILQLSPGIRALLTVPALPEVVPKQEQLQMEVLPAMVTREPFTAVHCASDLRNKLIKEPQGCRRR